MKTAVIGGGAAGFFLAVNLKAMCPQMEVTIFERGSRVLRKVEISGGGRCNCTNSFEGVSDLATVYPRGHRLMKRLFHVFSPEDAFRWFQQHGVPLVIQEDHCVFPQSQDAHSIIRCFLQEAKRLGVGVRVNHPITELQELSRFDFVTVTTGGQPRSSGLVWLARLGHVVVPPVPSLFSFCVEDEGLCGLMGMVVEQVRLGVVGEKIRSEGPMLITHWGLSGPAVLKLSSYLAPKLAAAAYSASVVVNWTDMGEDDVRSILERTAAQHERKQLATWVPFSMPHRLWQFLLQRAVGNRAYITWENLQKKDLNRLVTVLTNDSYRMTRRNIFKEEFVTCGGISLQSVHPATLESKCVPHLFFAGEVLDIDGITGGFNFQAAWTTAYTVAKAISLEVSRGKNAGGNGFFREKTVNL